MNGVQSDAAPFFSLSKTLIASLLLVTAFWWSAWLFLAAGTTAPLEFFPWGRHGYLAASLIAIMILFLVNRSIRRYSPRPSGPCAFSLRKDLFIFVIASLAIILFWEKVLVRGWIPLNAVFLYYFHPFVSLTAEYLQRGLLPLWNPWSNCGMPLLADPQIGAFYPPNLLFCFWQFPTAFRLWLFVHLFLLFVFTYAWMREKETGLTVAGVGAVVATFNGYVSWHLGYLSNFASLAWTPFLLHAAGRKSWRWVAIGFALQILAGHPQFAYMTLLMVGILLLAEKAPWKVWISAGLSVFASVGLVAFQVIPTFELIRQSVRSGVLSAESATVYAQSPVHLLKCLLLPLWNFWSPGGTGDPFLSTFYIGPFALALSVVALIQRGGWRKEKFPLTLVIVGIVLSLGNHTPVYRILLKVLPGLGLFRFPAQWMAISLWGFVLLATRGASGINTRWRNVVLLCLLVDLFAFQRSPSFLFVDPAFLSEKPPTVTRLQNLDGRVAQTKNVLSWEESPAQSSGNRAAVAAWSSTRDAVISSQGLPFHISEATSYTNHTLRNISAMHSLLRSSDERSLWAARQLGVGVFLDIPNPSEETPRFVWHEFTARLPRFRLSSGDPAPVRTLHDYPNALKLELTSRPIQKTSFTMADTFFPGWSAFSNGSRRRLAPNGPFREVEVDAEDRELLLRYDAPSFWIGLVFASILSAVLLGRGKKNTQSALPSLLFYLLVGAGILLGAKGTYDLFWGEPYANLFAPVPWEFVTRRHFLFFALAECSTGLICLGTGVLLRRDRGRAVYQEISYDKFV